MDKDFTVYYCEGKLIGIDFTLEGGEIFYGLGYVEFICKDVAPKFTLRGTVHGREGLDVDLILSPEEYSGRLVFCGDVAFGCRSEYANLLYKLSDYFDAVWRIPSLYSDLLRAVGDLIVTFDVRDVREFNILVGEVLMAEIDEVGRTWEAAEESDCAIFLWDMQRRSSCNISLKEYEAENYLDLPISIEEVRLGVERDVKFNFTFHDRDDYRLLDFTIGSDGISGEIYYDEAIELIRSGDFEKYLKLLCDRGIDVGRRYLAATNYGFGVERGWAVSVIEGLKWVRGHAREIGEAIYREWEEWMSE